MEVEEVDVVQCRIQAVGDQQHRGRASAQTRHAPREGPQREGPEGECSGLQPEQSGDGGKGLAEPGDRIEEVHGVVAQEV